MASTPRPRVSSSTTKARPAPRRRAPRGRRERRPSGPSLPTASPGAVAAQSQTRTTAPGPATRGRALRRLGIFPLEASRSAIWARSFLPGHQAVWASFGLGGVWSRLRAPARPTRGRRQSGRGAGAREHGVGFSFLRLGVVLRGCLQSSSRRGPEYGITVEVACCGVIFLLEGFVLFSQGGIGRCGRVSRSPGSGGAGPGLPAPRHGSIYSPSPAAAPCRLHGSSPVKCEQRPEDTENDRYCQSSTPTCR